MLVRPAGKTHRQPNRNYNLLWAYQSITVRKVWIGNFVFLLLLVIFGSDRGVLKRGCGAARKGLMLGCGVECVLACAAIFGHFF